MTSKRHASHENKTMDESKAKKAKTLANDIHEACLSGEIEGVKVLLKDGEIKAEVLEEITKKGTLITLSKNGKSALIKELLKIGVNPNCKNHKGQTPLHVACSKGHADIVKELLNYGANVNAKCNNKRSPLLSMNLWKLSDEIVLNIAKMLLEHGADINARGGEDLKLKTLLRLAADKGHLPLVCELLERGAEVNYRDRSNRISLHGAAEHDNPENVQIVRELIHHGANIFAEDEDDKTPLFVASVAGNANVVKELLNHYPEGHEDKFAVQYAAYRAALNGHDLVLREFIKYEKEGVEEELKEHIRE